MAKIFVDSTKTGGTDAGTSEANAFLTRQQALTAWTASDEIHVLDSHTEGTATISFTAANDSTILKIPSFRIATGGAYNPTSGSDTIQYDASAGGADITFNFAAAEHGMSYFATDNITFPALTLPSVWTDCYFENNSANAQYIISGTNQDAPNTFNGCTFKQSDASGGYFYTAGVETVFNQCTVLGTADATGLIQNANNQRGWAATFNGCDFSALPSATIMVDTSTAGDGEMRMIFRNCIPPASVNWTDGVFGNDHQFVLVENSDASGELYNNARYGFRGNVLTDTGVYYSGTGGYSDADGDTALSMKMEPASNVDIASPLQSLDMIARVDSTGSKTFTVECVENFTTAVTKRKAWIEVEYLGASGETLFSVATDREFAEASYTDLATGSGLGDWTAEPSGSRTVKLTASATVNQTGLYRVRLFLADYESGKVLHYNPAVTVT